VALDIILNFYFAVVSYSGEREGERGGGVEREKKTNHEDGGEEIFPFPVNTAKLIGDFYNNRRSAANSDLRFTYTFVSLMLRQYYWSRDPFSANRRSAANKK
jgi:hypothetical protein